MSFFFKHKVLIKPNIFEFLARKKLVRNYEIEVNNLLADNKLFDITQAQVRSITMKQSAETIKKSTGLMARFYTEYLRFCVTGKYITREALVELNHLKHILSLSETDVGEIHEQVIGAAYQKYVDEALAKSSSDNLKTDLLNSAPQDTKLSPELSARIRQQVKEKYMQNYFDQTSADEKLSPEEEDQLNKISRSLNIHVGVNDRTKSQLDKYKLYWVIENGTLPESKSPQFLEVGERCYFQAHCTWHEGRTANKNWDSAATRILKGDQYSLSSYQSNNFPIAEWYEIDTGTLVLTNHRIIFAGQTINIRIKLNKIESFEQFINGVLLNKEVGQSPFVKFDENVELFCLILSRLVK